MGFQCSILWTGQWRGRQPFQEEVGSCLLGLGVSAPSRWEKAYGQSSGATLKLWWGKRVNFTLTVYLCLGKGSRVPKTLRKEKPVRLLLCRTPPHCLPESREHLCSDPHTWEHLLWLQCSLGMAFQHVFTTPMDPFCPLSLLRECLLMSLC